MSAVNGEGNKTKAQHAPGGSKTKAKPTPAGARTGLIGVAAAVVLGLGGLIWLETSVGRSPPTPPPSAIGGPFAMTDQDGRRVDQHILDGRWSAVFFGYTYCPDVCPATLQALSAAAQKLGPNAKDFQVVFVTVDPERDTPAQMKTYIAAEDLKVPTLGLTGSAADVAAIAKDYKVYYARSGKPPNYTMDHSAAVYLMDPKGRFVSPLTNAMAPDQIAGEILKAEGKA